MASSSQKRHKTRKGKTPTEDHVVPSPQQRRLKKYLIIQDTLLKNGK